MGLLQSKLTTNCSESSPMICIICNNKIIDAHCAQCRKCKHFTHINCQADLTIKNKCVKCKDSSLFIFTNYDLVK